MESLISIFALCVAIWALLESRHATWREEQDMRYMEWWLRSMENRKMDQPDEVVE